MPPSHTPFLVLFFLPLLSSSSRAASPTIDLLLPSDAVYLLSFKSKADRDNKLLYALNERYDYCQWQGVKCAHGRVVRFVLQNFGLRGVFPPDTLSRLDQLRVLSLRNNSLSGPIPDLSFLVNLKSLFLDHNSFSGSFPPSILFLHRLLTLSLSHNNLTGSVPAGLTLLDRLISLRLDFNGFNGTLPPLNQSSLRILNVSGNNLTGPVPMTPTLSRLPPASFSGNQGLCGEIIHIACNSRPPFFSPSNASTSAAPLGQSAESQGIMVVPSNSSTKKKHKDTALILGFTIGFSVLIASILFAIALLRKRSNSRRPETMKVQESLETKDVNAPPPPSLAVETETEQNREWSEKAKKIEKIKEAHKSGNLVFCSEEPQLCTIEQLMRASAELLGRGNIGTTYKAVLDGHLIMTVKRLDAIKTAITSSQEFEHHMEMVGELRHPNLVPVRAYFQAKGERLVIYDYQPNGSLFNLIHGSKSTRAKPLHWTSCLKIAEDVAHGLAYIHQASRLIHGNLKSTNVLLGVDFEACVTDYGLALLAEFSSTEDPDSAAYKAPETRNSSRRATPKSDVYAFGVLLLELLTGKHPSQHPFLVPADMQHWVRAMRDDDGAEHNGLGMLTEVASICSATSPEQRPAMWQVLKMIQEIKDSVTMEDTTARI
ncbi:probable inactive receptor kinase At5g67200 [Neltuma alba]|uniref:probable inactive receptor kinase At5g67200 n=1 Tax=Neltuma alba TaxID=207710 RepID=UPI0010A323F4|nr:probable inactive receptor kinase At5g67200 [Prosopis alba]